MEDSKENPGGFEFLNLEGVCQAEQEILQNILRSNDSKEYSKGLFCFETPFTSEGQSESLISSEFEDEALAPGPNGDVAVPTQDSVQEVAEVSAQVQNGALIALSPHQQLVNQGPPPHTIPTFYPGQTHMPVSVSAAGGTMGPNPNAVHNQVTGNQMMMFTQNMPQMIQTPSGYSMPMGYQHGYYGPPGNQPHMSYAGPGEALNPESNYIPPGVQSHMKGHHDPHHNIPHSPNSANQGTQNRYGKGRGGRQFYYHPGSYTYGNVPYYNQQLAQNVTGSPIIMTAPGVYYPAPPHHSMYSQGPPGNEMEHHPGNMGAPPQSMAPLPNEISFAQQHHPGPQNHHINSPTHSNSRIGYNLHPAHRGNVPLPVSEVSASAPIYGDGSSRKPFLQNEKPVPVSESKGSSSVPNGSQSISKTVEEVALSSDELSHKTSSKPEITTDLSNINGDLPIPNKPKPNSEDSPVISQTEPRLSEVGNKDQSESLVKLGSKDNDSKSFPQPRKDDVVKGSASKGEPPSINGDLEVSFSEKSSINRDKVSADQPSSASGSKRDQMESNVKTSESKSKGVSINSSSLRGSNASATSITNSTSKSDESSPKEYPQLSASSNSVPPKGRSWASIASVKTPNTTHDGASIRLAHQSDSGYLEDQAAGDSSTQDYISSYNKCNDQHVPISQGDKAYSTSVGVDVPFDSALLTDENDPVALRLGEFLQKYSLDPQSIPLAPRGLCNQSNYCFLNATLQALLACPTFVNMFRAMTHILGRTPCKATPIIQSVFDFVNEFAPLIRGSLNKKDRGRDAFNVGPNLEPSGIRKCLGLLEGNTFKVEGRQEDAEEFLSHLLNGLHDEMIKVIKWCENKKDKMLAAVQPTIVNGVKDEIIEDEDDDQWQVMGANNKSCLTRKTAITKSPISEAFLGQMCSSLSRANALKSATLQPFYTLQLDIQNDNIRSVKDALEAISTKEEVSGLTSASGSEVEAWRQLSLEDLPPVLILHLKRFVYEKNSNRIYKIDKKLDFGVDLEIGKELLSNNSKGKTSLKQRQYKLFAVVYHDGEEAHKGHYVADCFHTSGGSMWGQWGWLRYDDTAVKQVPESQMLNPQSPRVPYLLYYRRNDTIVQQQIKKERS